MNKILNIKKIISVCFFAVFMAVFLSAGSAQASYWDWLNLNKANKTNNNAQQQAAVANADTGSSSSSSSISSSASSGSSLSANSSSSSSGTNYTLTVWLQHENNSNKGVSAVVWEENLTCRLSGISYNYCTKSYSENKTVTLYASVYSGGSFKYWSGGDNACDSTGTSNGYKYCQVKMTKNRTVQAIFSDSSSSSSSSSAKSYTLKVKINGSGRGKVISATTNDSGVGIACLSSSKGNNQGDCEVKFKAGARVQLEAKETDTNYSFGIWGKACGNSGTSRDCTLIMSQDRDVSATFNAKGKGNGKDSVVSVTTTGGGVGKVISVDLRGNGDGAINCGTRNSTGANDCSETYKTNCGGGEGGEVICGKAYFKAIPQTGSTFGGWGGDCLTFVSKNAKDQCYVNLDGAKTITASFNEGSNNQEGKNYNLTVTVSKGGKVESSDNKISCDSSNSPCKQSYGKNGTVTLKLTPNSGYVLSSTSGCNSDKTKNSDGSYTCKVKMTKNQNLTINFKASGKSSSSNSSSSSSNTSSSSSGSVSVDLKAREVKIGGAFGDYADSLTLNNANSSGDESIDLKWTVSGASSCSLSYDSNAKHLKSSVSSSDLTTSSGDTRYNTEDYAVNSSSRQTATYTLACKDSSGNSKSDSVSVTY